MSRGIPFVRRAIGPHVEACLYAARSTHAHAVLCGSWRRGSDRVGDVDVVVSGGSVPDMLDVLRLDGYSIVLDSGSRLRTTYMLTRDDVEFDLGRPIPLDVWPCPPDRLGAAMFYATGSGVFNVGMRMRAIRMGLELTFDGVHHPERGLIASLTEEDCLAALGLPWIPPERRTMDDPLVRPVWARP